MVSSRSSLGVLAKIVLWAGLALLGIFGALMVLDAVAPPVSTLMLARQIEGKGYQRIYAPLRDVAPVAIASIVASEDATFCQNDGVDWSALDEVVRQADEGEHARGASTITMQTAKNLFLWPGRSFIRKALEIGVALLIDKVWSKRRTLEIYLNIAEWGDGLFGIEAAAQRYFRKRASQLGPEEAALLATSLPNPIRRNPSRPSPLQQRLAAGIVARAHDMTGRLDCLSR